MNTAQTIFAFFFAISWGLTSNVLPRWKPFHYALCFTMNPWQPTCRLIVAFVLMNLIPLGYFCSVMAVLNGYEFSQCQWNDWQAIVRLVSKAVLPGLAPFGFYRLWIVIVQKWPQCFYLHQTDSIPLPFTLTKIKVNTVPAQEGRNAVQGQEAEEGDEPSIESLHIHPGGKCANLVAAMLYIFVGLITAYFV